MFFGGQLPQADAQFRFPKLSSQECEMLLFQEDRRLNPEGFR